MRPRRGTAVVLFCILMALAGGVRGAAKGSGKVPFEGTRWRITVTPDAEALRKGEKPFEDTLSFEGDKVRLSRWEAYGFLPSTFSATRVRGGAWAINTTQRSPTHGEAFWQAQIQGDKIHGEMRAQRKKSGALHYTFRGVKDTKDQ